MKHLLLATIAAVFFVGSTGLQLRAADRPNIILIFIDDMGWKDVACYGNDFIDTPHIDQLATDGMRFTDSYAAGAACSPTRCAVQSGQNQARIGITAHIPGHWRPFERVITPLTTMALPLDTVTVAEALKASGYIQRGTLGNGISAMVLGFNRTIRATIFRPSSAALICLAGIECKVPAFRSQDRGNTGQNLKRISELNL